MIETIDNVIYYYYDKNKTKFYTANSIFAEARASFYGTNDVYVEKVG